MLGDGEEPDEQQADAHGHHTPNVDCATTRDAHEDPREDGADKGDSRAAKSQFIGVGRAHASLFEEVGAAVCEGGTCKHLTGEDHASNLGAPEVGALEAVKIGGATGGFEFDLVGVDHHGDDVF